MKVFNLSIDWSSNVIWTTWMPGCREIKRLIFVTYLVEKLLIRSAYSYLKMFTKSSQTLVQASNSEVSALAATRVPDACTSALKKHVIIKVTSKLPQDGAKIFYLPGKSNIPQQPSQDRSLPYIIIYGESCNADDIDENLRWLSEP